MAEHSDDRRRSLTRSLGAWTLSLAVHAVILLVLALITIAVTAHDETEALVALGPTEVHGDATLAAGKMGEQEDLAADRRALSAGSIADLPLPNPTERPQESVPTPELPELSAEGFAAPDAAMSVFASLTGGAEAEGNAAPRGAGVLEGTSDEFQRMVARLRQRGLDVVFVIDATSSMGPYIAQSQQRMKDVVRVITGVVDVDGSGRNTRKTRFGVVAYKDLGDDYGLGATRHLALTNDFDKVQKFIDDIRASGGGDTPEPIHKALNTATGSKMGWRAGKASIVILIGDAPNHPGRRSDAFKHAATFARVRKGQVNAIDVGRETGILPDFVEIAKAGQGSAFKLTDGQRFWRHLIITVFGKQYENDVEKIVERFTED